MTNDARLLTKRGIVLVCIIPLIGAACLACNIHNFSLFAANSIKSHAEILTYVQHFTSFLLPRSIGELQPIKQNKGDTYFFNTLLMEFGAAMLGCLFIVVTIVFTVRYKNDIVLLQTKKVLIYTMIVITAIFFRPANFVSRNIASNFFDDGGFYLFKESVWIAVGYYCLATLLANEIVRRKQIYS